MAALPPTVPAAEARSSEFALVGTVVSGGTPSALIRHGVGVRPSHVAEGETLDGWLVEAIRLDSVVLRSADRRIELRSAEPAAPGRSASWSLGLTPPASGGFAVQGKREWLAAAQRVFSSYGVGSRHDALHSEAETTPRNHEWLAAAQRVFNSHKPAPASAVAADPWRGFIEEAAARFAVPQHWIREVMRAESGGEAFRNGAPTVSRAGAIGLMQVMPDTYRAMKERYGLGNDPADPHDNILAGAAYLREMYDLFGPSGFLAAYNAGPGRTGDYLRVKRPLPEETRRYVSNLAPAIARTVAPVIARTFAPAVARTFAPAVAAAASEITVAP